MKRSFNKEENKLLNSLAKRIDASAKFWFNCTFHPKAGGYWICYICGKSFKLEISIFEISEHGSLHLEESNLLSFI